MCQQHASGEKKVVGRAAGAREQLVEAVVGAFSTSTSLLVKACLLTHQGHMRAPAVGVKGPRRGSRGAAAVQRERRRRVDRAAVRSRCGDARCRVRGGAPRRRRRVRGGSAEHTIVHDLWRRRRPPLGTWPWFGNRHQIKTPNSIAGRGPVSGHQVMA